MGNSQKTGVHPAATVFGSVGTLESLEESISYRLDSTVGWTLYDTFGGTNPADPGDDAQAALGDINIGTLVRHTDPSPPAPRRLINQFGGADGLEFESGEAIRTTTGDGATPASIMPIAADGYVFGIRLKLPTASGAGGTTWEADTTSRVSIVLIDDTTDWSLEFRHNDGSVQTVAASGFANGADVFVVGFYDGDELHVWMNSATQEAAVDVGDVTSLATGQIFNPAGAPTGEILNAIFACNEIPANGIDDVQALVDDWLTR